VSNASASWIYRSMLKGVAREQARMEPLDARRLRPEGICVFRQFLLSLVSVAKRMVFGPGSNFQRKIGQNPRPEPPSGGSMGAFLELI